MTYAVERVASLLERDAKITCSCPLFFEWLFINITLFFKWHMTYVSGIIYKSLNPSRSNVRSPLCSSASIVIALFDFNLSCYYFLIPLEKSPADISKKCGGKSKRVRTIFTPEQLERLEAEFERQQYMVGPERLYLAHTLQLTEAQVCD